MLRTSPQNVSFLSLFFDIISVPRASYILDVSIALNRSLTSCFCFICPFLRRFHGNKLRNYKDITHGITTSYYNIISNAKVKEPLERVDGIAFLKILLPSVR